MVVAGILELRGRALGVGVVLGSAAAFAATDVAGRGIVVCGGWVCEGRLVSFGVL